MLPGGRRPGAALDGTVHKGAWTDPNSQSPAFGDSLSGGRDDRAIETETHSRLPNVTGNYPQSSCLYPECSLT